MTIEIHFKIKVSFRKEYAKAKEGENIFIWLDRRLTNVAVDMGHRSYFPVIIDSKYAWETITSRWHPSGLRRRLSMTSVCNSIPKSVASFYAKR